MQTLPRVFIKMCSLWKYLYAFRCMIAVGIACNSTPLAHIESALKYVYQKGVLCLGTAA